MVPLLASTRSGLSAPACWGRRPCAAPDDRPPCARLERAGDGRASIPASVLSAPAGRATPRCVQRIRSRGSVRRMAFETRIDIAPEHAFAQPHAWCASRLPAQRMGCFRGPSGAPWHAPRTRPLVPARRSEAPGREPAGRASVRMVVRPPGLGARRGRPGRATIRGPPAGGWSAEALPRPATASAAGAHVPDRLPGRRGRRASSSQGEDSTSCEWPGRGGDRRLMHLPVGSRRDRPTLLPVGSRRDRPTPPAAARPAGARGR